MGDWLDQVQAQEQRERDQAIAAQLAKVRPVGPSLEHCEACGGDIPKARQAIGGFVRCVPCQTLLENRRR